MKKFLGLFVKFWDLEAERLFHLTMVAIVAWKIKDNLDKKLCG